jgi:hypothetical protein
MAEAKKKSTAPRRRREKARPADIKFQGIDLGQHGNREERLALAMDESNVLLLVTAGMRFDDTELFKKLCEMAADPAAVKAQGALFSRVNDLIDAWTARVKILESFRARMFASLDRLDRDRPDLADALATMLRPDAPGVRA